MALNIGSLTVDLRVVTSKTPAHLVAPVCTCDGPHPHIMDAPTDRDEHFACRRMARRPGDVTDWWMDWWRCPARPGATRPAHEERPLRTKHYIEGGRVRAPKHADGDVVVRPLP